MTATATGNGRTLLAVHDDRTGRARPRSGSATTASRPRSTSVSADGVHLGSVGVAFTDPWRSHVLGTTPRSATSWARPRRWRPGTAAAWVALVRLAGGRLAAAVPDRSRLAVAALPLGAVAARGLHALARAARRVALRRLPLDARRPRRAAPGRRQPPARLARRGPDRAAPRRARARRPALRGRGSRRGGAPLDRLGVARARPRGHDRVAARTHALRDARPHARRRRSRRRRPATWPRSRTARADAFVVTTTDGRVLMVARVQSRWTVQDLADSALLELGGANSIAGQPDARSSRATGSPWRSRRGTAASTSSSARSTTGRPRRSSAARRARARPRATRRCPRSPATPSSWRRGTVTDVVVQSTTGRLVELSSLGVADPWSSYDLTSLAGVAAGCGDGAPSPCPGRASPCSWRSAGRLVVVRGGGA